MKLPRWTTWPALAVLATFLVTAVPRRAAQPIMGSAAAARAGLAAAGPDHKRVVILGIDGMDPEILAEVIARYPERMPNFRKLISEGDGIQSLGTATPPQSPVAWSNFITGRNPGGHGIFDFIHRNPMTRSVASSTVTESHADDVHLPGEYKFPMASGGDTNRSGDAFWKVLADNGVPADIWRMPINYPVEPALGLSFCGMMTPALDSAYGEFTMYSSAPPVNAHVSGGRFVEVREYNGRIDTFLAGPPNAFKEGDPQAKIPLRIHLDRENGAVAIDTGSSVIVLEPGQWSGFATVSFSLLPMGLMDLSGITRFYLRSIEPEFELYAGPINFDPLAPVEPVSQPEEASADLAEAIGPYYTQGMAEEVSALKSEVFTVEEFMAQAELVYGERNEMLDYALDHYLDKDTGGLLFFYYSTVDLCCHMMWRHHDEEHPHHDEAIAARDSSDWSGRPGSTWGDTVHDLYLKMDPVLGRLRERVGEEAAIIVMSDHGFAPYRREFSLNTWLLENDYLVLKQDQDRELAMDDPAHAPVSISQAVDWSKTKAYGVGFNGLYLNLAGRELDNPDTPEDESGVVQTGAEADRLLAQIKQGLEAEIDPKTGQRFVLRADLASVVYTGERMAEAPDLIVGYDSGYGNSDASTSGRIPHNVIQDNLGGTFNGSHLMAPDVVAGIMLTNLTVRDGAHALEDLTVEILRQYDIEPVAGMNGHAVFH
ncbi:MAG: hypothetical protein CMK00_04925 [Planctomycetes bacterium]|nr:hypothetical protein [Planctomycetota bacterium]